ncbi:MAG: peptidylprolyl isomerase [Nanoarchaeota archaeon]
MSIKKGDHIQVQYTGTLEDGSVFDSSEKHEGDPLSFEVGSGQIIKGFDDAVMGMEKGQEKMIEIKSLEAYGDVNPELVRKIPKEHVPNHDQIKPGMALVFGTPDGQQFPARIVEMSDTEVTVDLNHPLAGKTLTFKIKIVAIE